MRMLVPDGGLRGGGRVVWVDAKYKAHLQLIASQGWSGLRSETRDAHRADLHQALAYAALDDADQVDSCLVYPDVRTTSAARPAIATVAAGRRRVRLLLLGLPFGFRSPAHKDATLTAWRTLLAA
jgi:5-methylcytosine-specific restriction endonuclease McrBC regulatory subunit McrC